MSAAYSTFHSVLRLKNKSLNLQDYKSCSLHKDLLCVCGVCSLIFFSQQKRTNEIRSGKHYWWDTKNIIHYRRTWVTSQTITTNRQCNGDERNTRFWYFHGVFTGLTWRSETGLIWEWPPQETSLAGIWHLFSENNIMQKVW